MNKKVFCIGLNKTGTSSLHEAFKILGLKSIHFVDGKNINIKEIILDNYLKGNDILKGLEEYDAFSDWDKAPYTVDIYKEFDKQYPNSKFILNTRDLNGWLDSREKHVRRNRIIKLKHPWEGSSWLKIDRKAWELQFNEHYGEAYRYFKGREDDLLVFDITKGDGWEKLCPFLNLPVPAVSFPKKNQAPKQKSFFQKVIQ